jgi:hypothetical protein
MKLELAASQYRDTIAELLDIREIVRDEQHGLPGSSLGFDHIGGQFFADKVETLARFIKDQ